MSNTTPASIAVRGLEYVVGDESVHNEELCIVDFDDDDSLLTFGDTEHELFASEGISLADLADQGDGVELVALYDASAYLAEGCTPSVQNGRLVCTNNEDGDCVDAFLIERVIGQTTVVTFRDSEFVDVTITIEDALSEREEDDDDPYASISIVDNTEAELRSYHVNSDGEVTESNGHICIGTENSEADLDGEDEWESIVYAGENNGGTFVDLDEGEILVALSSPADIEGDPTAENDCQILGLSGTRGILVIHQLGETSVVRWFDNGDNSYRATITDAGCEVTVNPGDCAVGEV